MNWLVFLCSIQVVAGFFFLPQAQTPDGSNCLCGLTCSIVVERCRSCFGATCFMPVETSYAVTSFPPYQRPQLPRLSLSYDLVTPLPPMTIPLGVQYSMPQGVALPRPIAHSWPAPRPPLYIQVPASAMKTETNGRSEEEKVLRNADQKEKLHSAEAPPGPPSIPAPSTSLPASTGLYIPTTTVLSEEGDIDAAPIPIPSHSRPIKHEPELGLSFTPSLEDLETTSSATTTDPLDYPSERNSVDGNVSSVTTDNAIMSEYGQNAENLPDYLSNALDPTDATTTALSESTTISATAQRPGPLLVETAHIELYHPQGESFTESTESSTVTTAPTNAPSEIEITASQGDPPGYDGRRTENVPSDPLPPAVNTIKQHQILAPYSPPRTKPMNNEIFKVRFSGYETKNEEPYAAAPARNGSSGLLERSTVSYLGWKYNSKHRDSGITGKRSRLENGIFKKHALVKGFRRTKKMKHAVGYTKPELKAEPSPKCNSVKLRKVMQQKMTLSATVSKQMIYSAAVMRYPRSIVNVICSRHSFSYIVVTSPIYCEHRKARLTCFAFLQP